MWSQFGLNYFTSRLHKNHNGHMALLSHEGLPILIDIVCVFRYLSEKLYTIIESKLECTSGQTESSKIVVCQVLIIFETYL